MSEKVSPNSIGDNNSMLGKVLSESSVPGFSRFSTFTSRFGRAIWFLVILISFVGFGAHTIFLFYRYLEKETVTNTVLHDAPFVFPDVTICNTFPYNAHRIGMGSDIEFHRGSATDPDINQDLIKVNVTGEFFLRQLEQFWKSLRTDEKSDLAGIYAPENKFVRKTASHYQHQLGWRHNIDEVLLSCTFRGMPCDNPNNFTEYMYPYFERCWTLKPNDRGIAESGPANGLSLILHTADNRAFLSGREVLEWTRGFVINIHGPHTAAMPGEGSSLIAAAGKHTLIGLDMTHSVRMNRNTAPCLPTSSHGTTSGTFESEAEHHTETEQEKKDNHEESEPEKHIDKPDSDQQDHADGITEDVQNRKETTQDDLYENKYGESETVIATRDRVSKKWNRAGFRYSMETCMIMEKQHAFIDRCGCLSESYPVAEELVTPGDHGDPNMGYCHEVPLRLIVDAEYGINNENEKVVLPSGMNITTGDTFDFRTKDGNVLRNNEIVNINFIENDNTIHLNEWKAEINRLNRIAAQAKCHDEIVQRIVETSTLEDLLKQPMNNGTSVEEHHSDENDDEPNDADHETEESHGESHGDDAEGGEAEEDHCLPNCDAISYQTVAMAYDWPMSTTNAQNALKHMMQVKLKSGNVKDPQTLEMSLEKELKSLATIQDSFLKVDIYPNAKKGTTISESLSYPFSGFFSDFGAVMGLWLGMSIITFIEMITTCYAMCSKKQSDLSKKLFHRKQVTPESTSPVMMISSGMNTQLEINQNEINGNGPQLALPVQRLQSAKFL